MRWKSTSFGRKNRGTILKRAICFDAQSNTNFGSNIKANCLAVFQTSQAFLLPLNKNVRLGSENLEMMPWLPSAS